ncbi:MAG: sodium-dependent transporter [Bacteroidales bacterium]|nr:sodium-dependent transporter [Bacteroidales bacterium]
MTNRASFGSRVGAIAATVGSAVGLGNIWRFPYEAGENGGGAFIIVYIGCVLLLGIPVMLSEFIIGRGTHLNMRGALKKLSPNSKIHNVAFICVLGAIITLGFYSVVCGWVLEYLYQAAVGNLCDRSAAEYSQIFTDFISNPYRNVLLTVAFLAINFFVMLGGVRKGVERTSSVMMPLLFLMLLVFAVNSLLLPNAGKGLEFLFSVDFSQLTWRGVVDAFGQAFMSLTLGIAGLITFSSYFKDEAPLVRDACTIATLDTLVAILAGVVIFPAVFSFGMQPEAGPKLVFEVLPNIFQQMPGGYVWGVMFFVLLFFAALTSTISLSEIPITFISEEFHLTRKKATFIVAALTLVIAVVSALSFNVLSDTMVSGMNLFDFFNYLSSNFFMLMGGLFTAIYVGWFLDRKVITAQLTSGGRYRTRVQWAVIFCLRYIAPVAVVIIFLYYLGII